MPANQLSVQPVSTNVSEVNELLSPNYQKQRRSHDGPRALEEGIRTQRLSEDEAHYNPDVLSCLANLSSDEIFTPPDLVNQMLDCLPNNLWQNKNATFLDPACKSGIFLREITKRLNVGLAEQIPDQQTRINHILKHQVFGLAITELTALLSRRSVYCAKNANGTYSVCNGFENEQGNILYERIHHTWQKGKCGFCGTSQEVYERDENLESHAYRFIHTDNPHEIFGEDMKFDVIIGNPPYQLSDSGFGTSAKPIYQNFVLQAKKLNPKYLTLIIPARWFSGGKGLDEFRETMLGDNQIREIHDFPDASNVFPGVQIKGGVCFFLWKRDDKGLCKVTSYDKNKSTSVSERPLFEEGAETFVRYNEAIPILKKVRSFRESSMRDVISVRKPFGLDTTFKGKNKTFDDCIVLYQNGGIGYVDQDKILINKNIIEKYKVLIPPLGSGSDSFPHPILGKPFVVKPKTACTETYLVAGAFDNEEQAKNLRSYLTTKFLRFMVLLNKPTQHATQKVYQFVPVQDFYEHWTDEKLYKKYGLNQAEIDFIESMIRPMD